MNVRSFNKNTVSQDLNERAFKEARSKFMFFIAKIIDLDPNRFARFKRYSVWNKPIFIRIDSNRLPGIFSLDS